MADNPEMRVVDPDAPTEQSVKKMIMSRPYWQEYLLKNGFTKEWEGHHWTREWRQYGRGWQIVVLPPLKRFPYSPYLVRVDSNPDYNSHRVFAELALQAGQVPAAVEAFIHAIDRKATDATRKRHVKAYAATVPQYTPTREEGDRTVSTSDITDDEEGLYEALGPIKRPVPDDPAELDKEKLDQLYTRIVVPCFLKGTRVRVKTPNNSRLRGQVGTVKDSGTNSCYVELDSFADAGDPDPFRFNAEELELLRESADLDAPEPYLAAMDYLTPLKQAGYRPHPGLVGAKGFLKHVQGANGELEINVYIYPATPTKAVLSATYRQGTADDRMVESIVDVIDVADRVRELEELFLSSRSAVDYVHKVKARNYPNSIVNNREDHLIYLFGESIMEGADPDDPEPYISELSRHAEVIDAFRTNLVRLSKRMSVDNPLYRMFYIPPAWTELSYDLFLTPNKDGSWLVEAEGNREFQDQRGESFWQAFEIDQQWELPAGATPEKLEFLIADLLSDLRRHNGPDEPTIEGPEVDDIDEGIDDPVENGPLTQERTDFLKQEGYVYKANYMGNPHWEKKWPLPLPIKTGKTILTDLMIHPGHGQVWYSLVDAAGRPKGGWSIRLPGGDTPYTTSLRRALLKMRHVAERLPVDSDFNDMYNFVRGAFDKVQNEVERESRTVSESEADDAINFEQYAKDSADYNPVQMLTAKELRKVGSSRGYRVDSIYRSNRTTGFTLTMYPLTDEVFREFRENPQREADKMLDAYREAIIARLPELGKIERGGMYNLDHKLKVQCWPWSGETSANPDERRNHTLNVDVLPIDHEQRRNKPRVRKVKEGIDDPDDVDAEKYADDTLNVPKTLAELGYRHDTLAHFPHWVKYINPKMMFVIFHEGGTKWQFQVYRPHEAGGGRWEIKASSPGREVRTLRADLDNWEKQARAGSLLNDLNESVDDPDAHSFLRSTYDPEIFLQEQGWVDIDNKYHTKTFATPREYQLGNMVFTGVQVRIGSEYSLFSTVWIGVYFVARDGTGFSVNGYDLKPQLLFAWDSNVYPPDNHLDPGMSIRRFATSIEDTLNNIKWPEDKHAAVLANTQISMAVGELVKRLNVLAQQPLHPAVEESVDDVDPNTLLNQLPERAFVDFTRYRNEDDEIAAENYPGIPVPDQLRKQFEAELDQRFKGRYEVMDFQMGHEDEYFARVAFTGFPTDLALFLALTDAYGSGEIGGEFNIIQFIDGIEARGGGPQAVDHQAEDWGADLPDDIIEGVDDPDDPEIALRTHPGFHFQDTQFMGKRVYVKNDPDNANTDWPKEIGNVLEGPDPSPPHTGSVWYVIHVRGLPQYDLSDYGLGTSKTGKKPLRTFASKEDAALAIWMLRQEMEVTDGIMGLTRKMPK